ncbi:SIR2 family histone deacetylase, putative [Penicillium digitatum PHI26]|uniref:SIR2 family histone deacetylase, putative n=2 Tax=Penicillium digitatum TaxID=36651 RepID=K9GCC3_PEND2|nr:SIR2 family histone deacetylase, putative [Penicillium digitatum Pd1]EKV12508.1 SIR2 family histone deacetylase, putative [Penicillium digitatum PHI26]EKV16445.1 SIR2 family histone deacetylase, putative [Penicillium digitatum Pd1]
MASSASILMPAADLQSFTEYLGGCKRIVALLGAGISASSGLPTFRGVGGLWRSHDASSLATPEAFDENPDLVWQFYSYRRHMALQADPNKAHYALAELSRRNEDLITLSQNVDASKPSLETAASSSCEENYTDPIVPALEIPKKISGLNPSATDKTGEEASKAIAEALGGTSNEVDISDTSYPLATVNEKDLPQCPRCEDGLLRPGVVWFGEPLPEKTLKTVDEWIAAGPIDLCLVIGTSARIWPAAGYVHEARSQGARVAVCNMDPKDTPGELHKGDWFFQGDAGVIVPEILKSVIGEI